MKRALRTVMRWKGTTLASVGILSLAIGAGAGLFAVVDAVLFQPFPVEDPDELVRIFTVETDDFPQVDGSYLDMLDYAADQPWFVDVAGYFETTLSLSGDGRAEHVAAQVVTRNFFSLVRVRLPLGRSFPPNAEDSPSAAGEVVISDALFARRFGRDRKALGGPLRMHGDPYEIVGVLPPGFRGLSLDLSAPPDVWIVLPESAGDKWRWASGLERRGSRFIRLVARLNPGVDVEEAHSGLEARASQLARAYPETNAGVSVRVLPLSEARFRPERRDDVVSFLALLASVVGALCLMAGTNVAALILVRESARQKERAVQLALGAPRAESLKEIAAETVFLSGASLALAIPAAWAMRSLITRFPLPFQTPIQFDARIDVRVLGFATLLSLTGAAFVVLVATQLWRRPSVSQLVSRRGGTVPGSLTRRAFVALQIALTTVLVAGGVLFSRSLIATQTIDLGYDADSVMVFDTDLSIESHRYDGTRGAEFHRRVIERVRSFPEIVSAAWSGDVPLNPFLIVVRFVPGTAPPRDDRDWLVQSCDIVGDDYFRTAGVRLVEGRGFDGRDRPDATPMPIVVNRALADKHWPGESAIGKQLLLNRRAGIGPSVVVGVASNIHHQSLWGEPEPYLYLPLTVSYFPRMSLLVRFAEGSSDPEVAAVANEIRARIESVDPALPVGSWRLLRDQVDQATSQQRLGATSFSLFAGLCLLLASAGAYGVTSHSMARRVREIGIRSALGAEPRRLVRWVLGDGFRPVLLGVGTGLVVSLYAARSLGALLHGISPFDPVSFVTSAIIVVLAGAGACYLPARRAANLDPVESLRAE